MTDSNDSDAPASAPCARCGSADTSVAFTTPQMIYRRCHACGHLWSADRLAEPQKGRRRTDVP